jgi:nucleoside-diphosphate-sugar epimerase
MKNVLITGSTGMIGSLVLSFCLESDRINRVITMNRRPAGITHPKLTEVIHHDFTDYSLVEDYFRSIDTVYYCLGVYTGSVPRDEFRKITVDYTKAFADMLKKNSPVAKFCFLSGQGADRSEKSRMMFARDKGMAENYLIQCKFPETYIFRPAYIYPVTPRREPNFTYRLMRFVYPLFRHLYPGGVIESAELAKAIFNTGLNGGDMPIFENRDIKKILQNR